MIKRQNHAELEVKGRRTIGRAESRRMDAAKQDVKLVGVGGENAGDQVGWRQMIDSGQP